MGFTLAISGKGGVGKSTFAALAIRYLSEDVGRSVLAVDGDPNATLGALLGIAVDATIADLREETLEKKDSIPSGMSKDRFVEYRIQQSIIEHPGFDLLTMGRPEGPGCYCFVNSLLRGYLDKAASDYPYVVMDTEAGMEHLSRRTTTSVDLLVIVTEPTVVGADTARRIADLARTLPIQVRRSVLLLNRVPPDGVSPAVRERLEAIGLDLIGEIPLDEAILAASAAGQSLLELPKDARMFTAVRDVLAREIGAKKAFRNP
jgi:CO dehydrogenase maturation factor